MPRSKQGATRVSPTRSQRDEPNRLLRALPPDSYERVRSELEQMDAPHKLILWPADAPIRSVYFPTTSVVSLIVVLSNDVPVESATVGREGFLGVPILLGARSTTTQAIVQVAGGIGRLPATVFRRLVADDPELRRLCLLYAQALQEQTAQSVACNGRHTLSERCARWLLMTHDRVGADQFVLTQQFLATMLGVRRASVTVAAGMLQQAGMIEYRHGKLTVVDRVKLEGASCECYHVVRQKYTLLLEPGAGSTR